MLKFNLGRRAKVNSVVYFLLGQIQLCNGSIDRYAGMRTFSISATFLQPYFTDNAQASVWRLRLMGLLDGGSSRQIWGHGGAVPLRPSLYPVTDLVTSYLGDVDVSNFTTQHCIGIKRIYCSLSYTSAYTVSRGIIFQFTLQKVIFHSRSRDGVNGSAI